MKKDKRIKRPMTLLEIMVVIFIIGIIGSVIGYNMRGSMAKGKRFKTERAAEKLQEILMLECDLKNLDPASMTWNPDTVQEVFEESGMVKDVDGLMKDGWGEAFTVRYIQSREAFEVKSSHYPEKKKNKASVHAD